MDKLNFMTPINQLGYGVTGHYVIRELIKRGVDTRIFPIGNRQVDQSIWTPDILDKTEEMMWSQKVPTFHKEAPFIRNFHEFNVSFPPTNALKIVWPFFETNKLMPQAIHLLNSCDKLACPSEWAEEVFVMNGVTTPRYKAPQGVDLEVFKPMDVDKNQETYKFFNIGKWEARKSHQELVSAFLRAFPREKDVALYLMCSNPFAQPGAVAGAVAQVSKGDPRVRMLSHVPTHTDLAEQINMLDCGVFPSKGEGWGLPIMETLAVGKPIIVTFVTAQKDYLDSDYAIQVQHKGLVKADDGAFFRPDVQDRGDWYQIDEDDLVDKMRYAYENRIIANPKGREAMKNWTWSKAVDKLLEI